MRTRWQLGFEDNFESDLFLTQIGVEQAFANLG